MPWKNKLGWSCLLAGMSFLVLGAAPPPPPALELSDAEFADLTDRSTAIIDAVLQGPAKKPDIERAKAAALLIATAAQYSETPANAAKRSVARSLALDLTSALDQGNMAQGRNLLAALKAPPANLKPGAGQVVLGKTIDFGDVMENFHTTGGAKKLTSLAGKKDIPKAALTPELQMIAWQAATTGELSKTYNGPKVAKAPLAWAQFAEQMRQSGMDLASAVKAQNEKAARTALDRLETSCKDCHQKFK
jgi:hypothetical protein